MKLFRYMLLTACCIAPCLACAQQQLPMLGGQVIIEPGQTDSQIEEWFRILDQNGMRICRIRLFEEYMHTTSSNDWDFALFDKAFAAAEKYNVKIFATLFPLDRHHTASLGGFKLPSDTTHLAHIEKYITSVVSHFTQYKSLYGWVLINEPGTGGWIPDGQFAQERYLQWRDTLPQNSYSTNYRRLVNFDRQQFLADYNTWYLGWLASKVREHDSRNEIHVNNHQLFDNVGEYDFPAWRRFLTSLGTSAHPSWHFNYFKRDRYAVALAANCQIIRSGAGKLPFLITELQGGNNTYSGDKAFCPTREEITQWIWTGIGTGAQGVIFWSLNPRSVGEEAGEWALVDFQNTNTDRLDAVRDAAQCLEANRNLFSTAKPTQAAITLLYNRESLWVEKRAQGNNKQDNNYEGRLQGGVMKSTVAFYEILAENGIGSNISEINEFDWSKTDYSGQWIILANQIVLPSYRWEDIRHFVSQGGNLLVEGLSTFYDEYMQSLHNTGFPLADLFGGELQEIVCQPGDITGNLPGGMPIHLWKGFIKAGAGSPLSGSGSRISALHNHFGRGGVTWIPSLIGLGAIRTGNKAPLAAYLRHMFDTQVRAQDFSFKRHYPGVMMQTLTSGREIITIIINKNPATRSISLHSAAPGRRPELLFSDKPCKINGKKIDIESEGTVVIKWN